MRRLAVFVFLATTGFVPPKRDVQVEIAGVYDAVGKHPDGSTYAGKATLTRLSPDRYAIRFDMPNGVFRALCVRARDILGCGWGSVDAITAVVIRGNTVTWVRDGNDAPGREVVTGVTSDLTGAGTDPTGADYTSSWQLTAVGPLERVTWNRKMGGASIQQVGWGLRAGPVVVAGFPMPLAGAAFYRVEANGTQLVGEWMDPLMPDAGRGTETLTR